MSIHLELRSYRGGDRHRHDYSQILLPMQGAMRLDVEGHRSVVSSQCVAIIPREHEHDFEPTADCSMLILDVEAGAFAAAEDADSEGHEGRFYVFRAQELDELLGSESSLATE